MIKYLQKILDLKKRIDAVSLNLGWWPACVYEIQKLRQSLFDRSSNYTLISNHSQFPLICRPNTSDIYVFEQIFVEREYACLDNLANVDLIIDCGANVGYSSAYFLTRFPEAKVICIEPDSANFRLLEQNLAPYKDRVKSIRAGIWSHPTGLKIFETPYRDGAEWTVQVRECNVGEVPEMAAIDIGTLLQESGADKISVLKIDVEGAEAVIFATNYESWLTRVDNMVIELHDDSYFGRASDIVLDTVNSCKFFDISSSGELTVFKASV
jgi:FkbM family methyltransferase